MIDIHNHILPNIDDGAKSIEESIQIIKNAANAGVTDIVVTPHFILDSSYNADNYLKKELLEKVKEKVKKEKININLYLGNEVFVENDMLSLFYSNKITTLNASKYLLFELPFYNQYQGVYELLFKLKSNGIEPVLAHPERYSYFQKNPKLIFDIVAHGALLQADMGSYYGHYGKEAKKLFMLLLKHHAISFISTDTHHAKDKYYERIDEMKEELKKYITVEEIEELFTLNASCVIKNENFNKREIIPIRKNIFGKWK